MHRLKNISMQEKIKGKGRGKGMGRECKKNQGKREGEKGWGEGNRLVFAGVRPAWMAAGVNGLDDDDWSRRTIQIQTSGEGRGVRFQTIHPDGRSRQSRFCPPIDRSIDRSDNLERERKRDNRSLKNTELNSGWQCWLEKQVLKQDRNGTCFSVNKMLC